MFDKCFGYVLFLVFRYRQTKPMYEANDSSVSEFVFLGLSTSRPVQHFLLAQCSFSVDPEGGLHGMLCKSPIFT